ncbi:MAG: FAD-binding protein [Deltaproteobacteria bacterium]|nr:FAD-binding protein [Deltaproteobacteria bacterium]
MAAEKRDPVGKVMVVGAGIAGVQAALDLANAGFYVHLVEKKSAIGGVMAQLDKTFPTNDCSMCIISPKLVECGRHLNIEIHTLSEVKDIGGAPGNFTVSVEKQPRYIDPAKCTGCGTCAEVCPVRIPDEFNLGLGEGKAIYRLYPQAIPATFAIKKLDRAPCVRACPANLSAQGYVQLIKERKFPEALALIMDRLPLPGTIGRICPHPCEEDCRRQEVDEPIAICSLKRFVADQVDWDTLPVPEVEKKAQSVAIIGAGPSGLSCAFHLALQGYKAVIFEAAPDPGGWLRYGIPEYRLPREVLDREINFIKRHGVEIHCNSPIGPGRTINDLLTRDGFSAVFIGVGAQDSIRLPVPGSDSQGVLWGVEYLKDFALGKKADLKGKKVMVIGGGNVAMDVARTAKRQGGDVTMICLETREEMPASPWEVEEAEHEGIPIVHRWGVKQILGAGGKVSGLELKAVERVFDDAGRFAPTYFEDQLTQRDCDVVLMAIGQRTDLKFITEADGVAITPRGLIQADPFTKATSREGVFAGGDVETGPYIAIAAVAAGREAAFSIDNYLQGRDLKYERELPERPIKKEEGQWSPIPKDIQARHRAIMQTLPVEDWIKGFQEINLGFDIELAVEEAARCINCGVCSECMQCVISCQAQAVAHEQGPQKVDLEVGAMVLAPGFQTYDPSRYEAYHYAHYPNVVSSLEFERILSASGPYAGHLVRPSDHAEPKKIAWLQCVGSRDLNHCDNSYCSAVCCMYAIKQAVIAKEHCKEYHLDTAIFFMDMRTPGKDFEKYYWRAEQEHGVRFLRSRVHSIDHLPDDRLQIRYISEDGTIQKEEFDLVVLSVGLEISQDALRLARTLDIETKSDTRFATTDYFKPVDTSKEGIFVCGVFQGPKDIPQSVMEASAAAAAAGELLASARGKDMKKQVLPPEKDVSKEEPRIGVFVCNCGINIGGVIDVPSLGEYARTIPHVAYVEENLFTCSADTQTKILQVIEEHHLNRVMVASCSPRTHAAMFMETVRQAGLNPYLFEMANIRDQDSWVHMHEPEAALEKAKALVRGVAARLVNLEPLHKMEFPVFKAALVIGGGVAGMEAARSIADQGFHVYLVEKTDKLGGNAWNLVVSAQGHNYRGYLETLIQSVEKHPDIEILFNTSVKETSGFVGNFNTDLVTPEGPRTIEHGATVMATGGYAYAPEEYHYGKHPDIFTSLELDKLIDEQDARLNTAKQAVFIQCVGSREPQRPYCSRLCCTHSVESAIELKKLNPDLDIFVLYRDLRTYGERELLYKEARELGIIFIRFDLESKPQVDITPENAVKVTVVDPILGRPVVLSPDILTLASAILPNPTDELGEIFKVPRNAEGFFNEAHAKLRPVDFPSDGIFLAGLAHYPKPMDESIAQAKAAAGRAATILGQDKVSVGGVVAVVDPDKCAVCLTCVRACPFNVPVIDYTIDAAYIDPAKCQGCGVCPSECPAKAITLKHFTDAQIIAQELALAAG